MSDWDKISLIYDRDRKILDMLSVITHHLENSAREKTSETLRTIPLDKDGTLTVTDLVIAKHKKDYPLMGEKESLVFVGLQNDEDFAMLAITALDQLLMEFKAK